MQMVCRPTKAGVPEMVNQSDCHVWGRCGVSSISGASYTADANLTRVLHDEVSDFKTVE